VYDAVTMKSPRAFERQLHPKIVTTALALCLGAAGCGFHFKAHDDPPATNDVPCAVYDKGTLTPLTGEQLPTAWPVGTTRVGYSGAYTWVDSESSLSHVEGTITQQAGGFWLVSPDLPGLWQGHHDGDTYLGKVDPGNPDLNAALEVPGEHGQLLDVTLGCFVLNGMNVTAIALPVQPNRTELVYQHS